MKRFLFILLMASLSSATFAQFSNRVIESKYYRVYFQNDEKEAATIAQKLDAYFEFYNHYFHFDASKMENRLNVKILDSQENYVDYVSTTTEIESPVSTFLFIQYRDNAKSELIGFQKGNQEFEDTLSHYSFIQFFRNFIAQPPLWLEKGFAVYFGKSFYSATKNEIVYKENLTWLNTLKSFLEGEEPQLIDLNTFFAMDTNAISENSDLFYAQSWGLVKFLIENSNALYNRVIWDSINQLSPEGTKAENEQNVKKTFAWLDSTQFSKNFYEYIIDLKTFPQLVDSGIALYEEEKYNEAKIALIKAIAMEDKNYIPYYYLGLIHYNIEDYAMADFYYNSALQMKGDKAICYYALGVNAFAEQDYEKSIRCLKTAVAISTDYEERANKIIDNIRTILRLQNRKIDIDALQPYPLNESEVVEEESSISSNVKITTLEDETEIVEEEVVKVKETAPAVVEEVEEIEEVADTVEAPEEPNEDIDYDRLRLDKDTGEYILN